MLLDEQPFGLHENNGGDAVDHRAPYSPVDVKGTLMKMDDGSGTSEHINSHQSRNRFSSPLPHTNPASDIMRTFYPLPLFALAFAALASLQPAVAGGLDAGLRILGENAEFTFDQLPDFMRRVGRKYPSPFSSPPTNSLSLCTDQLLV